MSYGNFIEAIGYNLKADGLIGITDGTEQFQRQRLR